MGKENGRSRQANRKKEQIHKKISDLLKRRDVHVLQGNVSKLEALEFAALFIPDGEEKGEEARYKKCVEIKNLLSTLGSGRYTEEDVHNLYIGYQHLAERWNIIQSSLRIKSSYHRDIYEEITYVERCMTAFRSGYR